MVNQTISKVVKIMIVSIIFLISRMPYSIVYGQYENEVIAKLEQKEINGDSFNGEISMTIRNNLKEKIYFTLEPFYCYSKSDSIIFYLIIDGGGANEISFFNKDSKIVTGSAISLITFLKFPTILLLEPGENTTIRIRIDKEGLSTLQNMIWNVNCEIYYAIKSKIDFELRDKSEKIIREFSNSVIYKDTINIDLELNSKPTKFDSLYKAIKKENYPTNNESLYDSILKNFWHRPIYL